MFASVHEIGNTYQELGSEDRVAFLRLLNDRYKVDESLLKGAFAAWDQAADPVSARRTFLQLTEAVETPRGKLLSSINMAPGGTRMLVDMRADILKYIGEHPELELIEADLRHLLASWFNRGFLELRRIGWTTTAAVLDKLFEYETVHPIENWGDIKRRLQSDRQIFAFFHPALPDDPLIFVEVALVKGISDSVQDLLDEDKPQLPAEEVDTAIFFSINSAQAGLGGINLGNFLIRQVVDELQDEFPGLKTFATLSPVPRLREVLADGLASTEHHPLRRHRIATILHNNGLEAVCRLTRKKDIVEGLFALLDNEKGLMEDKEIEGVSVRQLVAPVLTQLTLVYLTEMKNGQDAFDPEARFHLSNGARLERIVPFADTSPNGMHTAYGVMVNYLYNPSLLERKHEAYAAQGRIDLSPDLARQLKATQKLEA